MSFLGKTLKELAESIGGEVVGDPHVVITGVSGIKEARAGDITFLANPRYQSLVSSTGASAIITSKEITQAPKPLIRTDNPSLAFSKVVALLFPQNLQHFSGVHKTAIIGKGVSLGADVAVGPYVIIEDKVSIGRGTVIYGSCYIGTETSVGERCLFYPHVLIRESVQIGNRVIIHNGTVIGSDGFGYVNVDGVHHKIPQIGTVIIQDDVEIGANVTIDRARFDKTLIGKGTKIDNLVHIAHNVVIGENSIIVAQVGISGSVTVGKDVILAGQAGISGHLEIGDGAVVMAQAGVTKSVPAHTQVSGYPAKEHAKAKRVNAHMQRLPELYRLVKELQEKVAQLQERINGKTEDHI